MRVDYTADGRLRTGGRYTVYAIAFWRNELEYLLAPGKETQPSWYPARLFTVSVPSLAGIDTFGYFGDDEELGTVAVWGYSELAADIDHGGQLSEREPAALSIFLTRKREIDELNKS
jgi:hypothetical protein